MHAQIIKTHEKDPPWFMRSKKRNSNFKLLVALPNNVEAGKTVLLIHPIKYDRSGQNKLMHYKELRKAEHLSTTNDLFEILHNLNAYSQTIYVYARSIRYAVVF